MHVKPKYKTARRLGAHVFEKTQTDKFASRTARRVGRKNEKIKKSFSNYGLQLIEKQRVRVMYGVSERQLARYITEAQSDKTVAPAEGLFMRLESRLDNVIARIGLAPTRRAARQMVSHGHFLVNNVRTTIPSYRLQEGDVVSVREGSLTTKLFEGKDLSTLQLPLWIQYDEKKKVWSIIGKPAIDQTVQLNFNVVIEFYSR